MTRTVQIKASIEMESIVSNTSFRPLTVMRWCTPPQPFNRW